MQTLLEIRQRAEEAAKQAFSDALQAQAKEERRLRELEADLQRRKQDRTARVEACFSEMAQKRTAAKGFANLHIFENRLKDEEAQVARDIEAQKLAVSAAQKQTEQRRLEMVEASRELKALEKHKEKWWQGVKADREAREDRRIEEVGNVLHLARSRRGKGDA
jgi:flagellar export protein FliJ